MLWGCENMRGALTLTWAESRGEDPGVCVALTCNTLSTQTSQIVHGTRHTPGPAPLQRRSVTLISTLWLLISLIRRLKRPAWVSATRQTSWTFVGSFRPVVIQMFVFQHHHTVSAVGPALRLKRRQNTDPAGSPLGSTLIFIRKPRAFLGSTEQCFNR